jgi:hypothetical protein
MKPRLLYAFLCATVLASTSVHAANRFSFGFGVIFPASKSEDDSVLREAIEESDADNLAFVVANGIKSPDEPCTDKLYEERKQILDAAKHGLIVSLAAGDWAECRNDDGKPASASRLNRLRELLFADEFSTGGTRIPVVRQSTTIKFRSYAENMRWQVGNIMFATINLPGNNNDYVTAAGRNAEFEDRLVANRDWLHRLFIAATQKKASAIVLFCDGNPLSSSSSGSGGKKERDGFAEIRRHIGTVAAKFTGRILIIHGQGAGAPPGKIIWHGKLGEATGSGLTRLAVNPASPELFTILTEPAQAANRHRGN